MLFSMLASNEIDGTIINKIARASQYIGNILKNRFIMKFLFDYVEKGVMKYSKRLMK